MRLGLAQALALEERLAWSLALGQWLLVAQEVALRPGETLPEALLGGEPEAGAELLLLGEPLEKIEAVAEAEVQGEAEALGQWLELREAQALPLMVGVGRLLRLPLGVALPVPGAVEL